MKKIVSLIICLAFAASLCACSATEENGDQRGLSVITTVFPAYDFAREIAGEENTVTLLVPPGAESHSYEPTAQDMIRLQNCDLLICNGGESEAWIEQIADALDGQTKILCMMECVDALTEETKEGMQTTHEEEEEGEEEFDEHVWTSPLNAARISRAICDKLCMLDGDNSALYNSSCEAYCAALDRLDAQFREITQNAENKTVIFADRFPVRYFTEEYGLDYYAAFAGCADDAEPSAKTVAFLIDKVRENAVPAVFYIEFSNEKMADVICEDTGCEKLLFHSCHNVSRDELRDGVTYLELMQQNAENLREALG